VQGSFGSPRALITIDSILSFCWVISIKLNRLKIYRKEFIELHFWDYKLIRDLLNLTFFKTYYYKLLKETWDIILFDPILTIRFAVSGYSRLRQTSGTHGTEMRVVVLAVQQLSSQWLASWSLIQCIVINKEPRQTKIKVFADLWWFWPELRRVSICRKHSWFQFR